MPVGDPGREAGCTERRDLDEDLCLSPSEGLTDTGDDMPESGTTGYQLSAALHDAERARTALGKLEIKGGVPFGPSIMLPARANDKESLRCLC